jgi:hypothetical protein
LFPQALQSFVALLASERAATFVFDFPDILNTSFHLSAITQESTKITRSNCDAQSFLSVLPLLIMGKSRTAMQNNCGQNNIQ